MGALGIKFNTGSDGVSPAANEDTRPLIDLAAIAASLALARNAPHLSAMPGVYRAPARPWVTATALSAIAALLAPAAAVHIATIIAFIGFGILVAWRALLLFVATAPGRSGSANGPAPLPAPLPNYTILVPLYDEAGAVPGLARAMSRLDWPAERLDQLSGC